MTCALFATAGMRAVTSFGDAFHTTVTRSPPRSSVTRFTAAGHSHWVRLALLCSNWLIWSSVGGSLAPSQVYETLLGRLM